MVREALLEGHSEIIAVGGDGTINEAVNGFFDENGLRRAGCRIRLSSPAARVEIFAKASASRPARTAAIARLEDGDTAQRWMSAAYPVSRDMANRWYDTSLILPLSACPGLIVDSVNRARIAKLFGGSFAFRFSQPRRACCVMANARCAFASTGSFDEITNISTVAVANGVFFGGGMKVAPNAKPDDGYFDVVIIGGTPKHRVAADMKLIYTGEHLNNPAVRVVRGQKVVAVPVAETRGKSVLIEVDGENAGRLPATFEILPRALNLRC